MIHKKAIRPNFFIIGAPNSGSTSLWHLLQQHPDVYLSPVKEPRFFTRDDYERNWDSYLGLFLSAGSSSRVGEASVSYCETHIFPQTPSRIHAFAPQAKIVYIVREPISRLESCWRQALMSGHWYRHYWVDKLMPLEFTRAIYEYPHFIETCRYWKRLEPYLTLFDEKQVHVVLFEEFVANLVGVMRGLFDFLEVDPGFSHFCVKGSHKNSGKMKNMFDPKHKKLLQLIYHPKMPAFPSHIFTRAANKFLSRIPVLQPQWTEILKQGVYEELKEDNRCLLHWMKKPLSTWPHTNS